MPEIVATAPPTDADRLDEAEAIVRAYAGWHIAPARTETVVIRSNGGTVLRLPSLGVTAVAAASYDGQALDRFDWYPNGCLVRSSWPVGPVTVEFTHGHPAVPDLHPVIRALAARAAASGPYVQVGQVRTATDASGAPLGATLTDSERAVLDRYRLPSNP